MIIIIPRWLLSTVEVRSVEKEHAQGHGQGAAMLERVPGVWIPGQVFSRPRLLLEPTLTWGFWG